MFISSLVSKADRYSRLCHSSLHKFILWTRGRRKLAGVERDCAKFRVKVHYKLTLNVTPRENGAEVFPSGAAPLSFDAASSHWTFIWGVVGHPFLISLPTVIFDGCRDISEQI
jgi:hypothetical protein